MNTFSPRQLRLLTRKLDRRHVQSRKVDGKEIDYLEGWFVMAEANAIFGFSGWDREMTHFDRVYERSRSDGTSCAYLARVRIRVRAGDAAVIREGTGWGSATASLSGEAHERAIKAAETDATKRALATFGNRFGLALYDPEQNGVTGKKPSPDTPFTIYDCSNAPFASGLSGEAFCGGLRQIIEQTVDVAELTALYANNKGGIARLKIVSPGLRTAKGSHYSDILKHLIQVRLKCGETSTRNGHGNAEAPLKAVSNGEPPKQNTIATLNGEDLNATAPEITGNNALLPVTVPLKASRIAPGPRIDKSALLIGTDRRLHDKAHLQFVGTQACLVCGRQPCHAHHLTFMQRRGVGLKSSDEYAVPLCAVHHDELHRSGAEKAWWENQNIDPKPIAAALWAQSQKGG